MHIVTAINGSVTFNSQRPFDPESKTMCIIFATLEIDCLPIEIDNSVLACRNNKRFAKFNIFTEGNGTAIGSNRKKFRIHIVSRSIECRINSNVHICRAGEEIADNVGTVVSLERHVAVSELRSRALGAGGSESKCNL